MFGTFFATTYDFVKIASDKVSMVVDWITKNLQEFISKAIDVTLYFLTIIDSTVGIFLAMFQGDWSGAGAMALDVVAKVADGMASVVRLVATPLDWIANKVTMVAGILLQQVGVLFSMIEKQVREAIGFVVQVMTQIADMVSTVGRYFEQLFQMGKEAYWKITNPVESQIEGLKELATGTIGAGATKRAVEAGSSFSGFDKTIGDMKIFANKLISTSGSNQSSQALIEMGKSIEKMGTNGLGVSKILEDALTQLAEISRNKADELDPDAQNKFGGSTDALKKILEDLKKSLGTGKVVDPLGEIVDTLDKTKDVAGGGSSTASIDTALGTVKMAGSFDKQAMMQKNQLTEAQKQTMILKQVENLLGNAGKNGENFTQVKDASGNMISVSKELTKMVTRMDVNDPTGQKTITAPEMLTGQEMVKRQADLKLIAENMLGGQKDMSGVDMQGIMNSDPEFLRRTVQESSAISSESKAKFADGGDPEQRKLINETNTILKKIASSKNGSPFS